MPANRLDFISFPRLTTAASASWDQLKTSTAAGVKDALKNRKVFIQTVGCTSIEETNGHAIKFQNVFLNPLDGLATEGVDHTLVYITTVI